MIQIVILFAPYSLQDNVLAFYVHFFSFQLDSERTYTWIYLKQMKSEQNYFISNSIMSDFLMYSICHWLWHFPFSPRLSFFHDAHTSSYLSPSHCWFRIYMDSKQQWQNDTSACIENYISWLDFRSMAKGVHRLCCFMK